MKEFLLIVSLLVVSPVHARDISVERLLDMCEGEGQINEGGCLGYFSGILDTTNFFWLEEDLELTVCFPVDISSTRIKDMSISYLKGKPKLRNFHAIVVLWSMYSKTFPCPTE